MRGYWRVAVGFVSVAVLVAATGCGGDEQATKEQNAKRGGTLRINLSADIDHTDPALAYTIVSWQLEYATCVKLLNYPEKPGAGGSTLLPEAADEMPERSPDGKTYTFTVTPRFRFSPPSNERVTAKTFQFAIERVLNPKLQSPGASFVTDIAGAEEFVAGKSEHVGGISVVGNRLRIRLQNVAPDFLSRIAMPLFCAVPLSTPLVSRGVLTVPGAGPYYVASRSLNRRIVLERNPNYTGNRPQHLDRIVYTVGGDPSSTLLQIKRGQVDHAGDFLPPAAHGELYRDWGAGSDNAKNGKQRYFVNPLPSYSYFALNTDRPLFRDLAVRQAVNFAIDRPALVRQAGAHGGTATDQYLPPVIPGYRDADVYPLDGPNVEKARELMRGRRAKAILYTCNQSPCPETAQIFQANLKQIGIEIEIRQFDYVVAITKAGTKGEPYDAFFAGFVGDYADPYDFINVLLEGGRIAKTNNQNYAYFDDPAFNRKMEAASRLEGDERWDAYAALDEDIARNAAPLAVYANGNKRSFFSERIGCQLYHPVYTMSLASLCVTE